MDILEDVVIPIVAILAVFGTLFGTFYFWITRRHVERLALIERGLASALAPNAQATLRAACVVTGLSLGMLLGWLLVAHAGMPGHVAYTAAPAAGIGGGLLVFLRISGGAGSGG